MTAIMKAFVHHYSCLVCLHIADRPSSLVLHFCSDCHHWLQTSSEETRKARHKVPPKKAFVSFWAKRAA